MSVKPQFSYYQMPNVNILVNDMHKLTQDNTSKPMSKQVLVQSLNTTHNRPYNRMANLSNNFNDTVFKDINRPFDIMSHNISSPELTDKHKYVTTSIPKTLLSNAISDDINLNASIKVKKPVKHHYFEQDMQQVKHALTLPKMSTIPAIKHIKGTHKTLNKRIYKL